MRTEETPLGPPPPMHCTKSIKPCLTYKLDQIRKQNKIPQNRNILDSEAALQEERKLKAIKEVPSKKTSR